MTTEPRSTAGPPVEEGTGRPHIYEFYVRFADIDQFRHVNNVKFVGYLEDARTQLLYADPVRRGEQPFGGLVVRRHEIEYLQPLDFGIDPVHISTRVRDAKAASFILDHELWNGAECCMRASTVVAAYDVEQSRPRRLCPDERAYLAEFGA